jgi:hypothetical protein
MNMKQEVTPNTTSKAAPYAPFKTFLAAIESLEQGMPNQLDRSVWPSYSGAMQGQLLAAFKYLRLVDDAGHPTPELHELVEKKEARKKKFRSILEACYADLVALNLSKVSPKQLDDAIRGYGFTGATHRKALSFFLKSAQYAEIPLSNLLKRKTRETGSPRRKKNGNPQKRTEKIYRDDPLQSPPTGIAVGESKTIQLRTGGSLTLILSVKFLEMGVEDREFAFKLLDQISAYEQKKETAST